MSRTHQQVDRDRRTPPWESGIGPATAPVVRHVASELAKVEGTTWAEAEPDVRVELLKRARALLQEERAFLTAIGPTEAREDVHDFESGIWFRALHKSASMFIYKLCSFIDKKLPQSWEFYSSNNKPPNVHDAKNATGSFVGILRKFEPLKEELLDRRPRTIFQLRDPRDILVSEYFSLGFIHGEQKLENEAKEMRDKIQSGDFTIDDFVLYSAENGSGFFGQSSLRQRMNVDLAAALRQCDENGLPYLVVRYEDMVLDFPGWVTRVLDFMHLSSLRDPAIERFHEEFDVKAVEDRGEVMTHKRVIIPGDYRTKLKPETIAKLNEIFDPVLSVYYKDLIESK